MTTATPCRCGCDRPVVPQVIKRGKPKVYATKECGQKHWRDTHPHYSESRELPDKVCDQCGFSFHPYASAQMYCSLPRTCKKDAADDRLQEGWARAALRRAAKSVAGIDTDGIESWTWAHELRALQKEIDDLIKRSDPKETR